MSHIATGQLIVEDVKALEAACARVGVQFMRGQSTYKWYASGWQDDSPIPDGMFSPERTAELRAMSKPARTRAMNEFLGKDAAHAINVPGSDYDIGVVPHWSGRGYNLIYDDWNGGVQRKLGAGAAKLKQAYGVEKARADFLKRGHLIRGERVLADGTIELLVQGR